MKPKGAKWQDTHQEITNITKFSIGQESKVLKVETFEVWILSYQC